MSRALEHAQLHTVHRCSKPLRLAALPGIATNLLADRLHALELDGLIEKDENGLYGLTPAGRELEEAVYALVRWGGRWMAICEPTDMFRPEWLVVALRSLLPKNPQGAIEIHVGEGSIWIDADGIRLGGGESPDAVIESTPTQVLGCAAGQIPISSLLVHGDKQLVANTFATS